MQISPMLVLHISGGITGILSGAVAMVFRKGSRGHVVAAQVFVIAMLCMSASGAYMAYFVKLGSASGGIGVRRLCRNAWLASRA